MNNTVVNYLDISAEKFKDKIAIQDDNCSVSFLEYRNLARSIGTYLINIIKDKNMPIVIYMQKSCKELISFMGILYSGNYYCPMPYNSPDERSIQILSVLNMPYIITDNENLNKIRTWNIPEDKILIYEKMLDTKINNEIIDKVLNKIIDTDPAYTIFTSGSTGIPKGVVVPHRAIIDYIQWEIEEFNLCEQNKLANQAPFHFDASIPDIYTPLFTGASLYIIPEKLFIFPLKLIKYINKYEINTLIWIPSALIMLTNKDVLSKCRINNLRLVMFCGEVMPNKYLNIWRKVYPSTLFVNLYGPTETTYASTYYKVNRKFEDDEVLPIGYPCKNTDIILIDDTGNKVTDINVAGEICIKGSGVALGYYGKFENTAFCINPCNKDFPEIIYKTGDLGKINEYGELIYIGRNDFQIKHMGYRIELGEIENAIRSLDKIRNGCVLYDEKSQNITLFYEADNDCDKNYIICNIKDKIPKYMYPTKFYRFDEIPLNINGKIDRNLLKKYFQ